MGFRSSTCASACAISIALMVFVTGCSHRFGAMQVGSLPRPGLFTFFELADTSTLLDDEHRLRQGSVTVPLRGIVYTKRAGFIDLAHVHNTTVLATEFSRSIENGLLANKKVIELSPIDDNRITAFLKRKLGSPDIMTGKEIREKSRLIGECIALDVMAWHEIETWFGYRTTRFWTEKPSAFTYEDIASHFIGAKIFELISVELDEQSYGKALMQVLNGEGLVSREAAADAVDRVKGSWWSADLRTKRFVETGGADASIKPWLVPLTNSDYEDGASSILRAPCSTRMREFTLNIAPAQANLALIRRSFPALPTVIDPDDLFPILVEILKIEMEGELGEKSTQR